MTISSFKDPWILWAIAFIPLIFIKQYFMRKSPDFLFSSEKLLSGLKMTIRMRLSAVPLVLRAAGLICVIIALARPQSMLEGVRTTSDGVDIVLALDTSSSMLAEDFRLGDRRINRFDVVKEVVKDFIQKRKDDRVGMVAFSARAYTVCPLSTDYDWICENLDRVVVGMIEDGTAIGSAIATSVNRLKTSKTKSKVIILLTDGVNTAGSISPDIAAEAARALKIKIYTIGVGTKGLSPYPFKDNYGRTVYRNIPIEMDEPVLKKIADTTGGKYYLASDTESLRKIYDDINRLEKSNIEHFGYKEYEELFRYFLIPGIMLILIEIFLSNTVFSRIP